MNEEIKPTNFIKQIIDQHNETGRFGGKVVTRFPPEPNGHLHIGHAKAIMISYDIAQSYNGVFHLRFDDTNPDKESDDFVESIKKDLQWLGTDYGKHLYFSSSYFDKIYELANQLIKAGKAYIDEQSPEEIKKNRGNIKEPGVDGPFRNRPIEESLEIFERMKNGELAEGEACLRAKIDMQSSNMNLRDPIIYRIKKTKHHRVGDKWKVYPIYDFTHPISDSIEGITHSLCSLEFEDHRPLYDWVCEQLDIFHPQQIEFSRLNLDFTVMSKRKLQELVEQKHVAGWDDPRMPTLSGMKRRGFSAAGIRSFCDAVGVTKKDSNIAMSTLEYAIREDLGRVSPRAFGVIRPLKVVIENWDGEDQEIEVPNHPQDESFGKRTILFGKEIYIEIDDFMEAPPKKYFRLSPGGNVRLKYAYVINCHDIIKDQNGVITELRCTYLKETFAGHTPEGMKKVKGIINWVHGPSSLNVEMRLYDRLFNVPRPTQDKEKDFTDFINPESLNIIESKIESSLKTMPVGQTFQLERQGYYCIDPDSTEQKMVVNRTITLRDTWEKIESSFATPQS